MKSCPYFIAPMLALLAIGCVPTAISDHLGSTIGVAHSGTLNVHILGDFSAARKTLATTADIEQIDIGVEIPGLALQNQSVSRTQLAASNGAVTRSFGNLPTGIATISTNVFNEFDIVIGAALATASIVDGQTTNYSTTIQLINSVDNATFSAGVLTTQISLNSGTNNWNSGQVSTIAGSGAAGPTDAASTSAEFNYPNGIVIDPSGNIIVADQQNHNIRLITSSGQVTKLAGNGTAGSTEYKNGVNSFAQFNVPMGLAVDPDGNVLVADSHNHKIRLISRSGNTAIEVSTYAGGGNIGNTNGNGSSALFNFPYDIAVDRFGNAYVADLHNNLIRKIDRYRNVSNYAGAGGGNEFADGPAQNARFSAPMGVTVDYGGNVYVADYGNFRVRKISRSGVVSTLAGSGTQGYADGQGSSAQFSNLHAIEASLDGNVYVADGNRIRKVSPSGLVTTIAGQSANGWFDGLGRNAMFYAPTGLALDSLGKMFISDSGNNRIRKIE